MASRPPRFHQAALIDTTPLPNDYPKVQEITATSAPLYSAAYFIGARCSKCNDEYMQCKDKSNGRGEFECFEQGRRVTECAAGVLQDIRKHCLEEFRNHWRCLDNNNMQLWNCRRPERVFNKCVFDNLKLEKLIPGTPPNETPVHLRKHQIFAAFPQSD